MIRACVRWCWLTRMWTWRSASWPLCRAAAVGQQVQAPWSMAPTAWVRTMAATSRNRWTSPQAGTLASADAPTQVGNAPLWFHMDVGNAAFLTWWAIRHLCVCDCEEGVVPESKSMLCCLCFFLVCLFRGWCTKSGPQGYMEEKIICLVLASVLQRGCLLLQKKGQSSCKALLRFHWCSLWKNAAAVNFNTAVMDSLLNYVFPFNMVIS